MLERGLVLDVDAETLNERLDNRPDDDWGKRKSERELILLERCQREDAQALRTVG